MIVDIVYIYGVSPEIIILIFVVITFAANSMEVEWFRGVHILTLTAFSVSNHMVDILRNIFLEQ